MPAPISKSTRARVSEATHAGIRTRSNGTVDDGWDGSLEAKVCMLQFSSEPLVHSPSVHLFPF